MSGDKVIIDGPNEEGTLEQQEAVRKIFEGSAAAQVIAERATFRADFREQAASSQFIKAAFHAGPNWGYKLTPAQKECLDEMANKFARILTGDPNEPDAWLDLSGYPLLIYNIITKGKPT